MSLRCKEESGANLEVAQGDEEKTKKKSLKNENQRLDGLKKIPCVALVIS